MLHALRDGAEGLELGHDAIEVLGASALFLIIAFLRLRWLLLPQK